jgi:hypothetical protein
MPSKRGCFQDLIVAGAPKTAGGIFMTPNASASQRSLEQLDFFDLPQISLPPCGRGRQCVAVVERDQIRCLSCHSVARRTTILDDFFKIFVKSQIGIPV